MKRLVSITLALLAVLVMSCADDVPTAALDEDASPANPARSAHVAPDQISPHTLLSRAARCLTDDAAVGCASKSPRAATTNGFAGPLFGLATAPNGDVLVADAGAGIAERDGHLDIPLPGVTGIGPIGRGSMWATTGAGPNEGDPERDSGQALYRASKGNSRMIANLFAFEDAYDPDDPDGTKDSDSNPYDVASLGGQAALVVDAGGNDLLRVDNQGHIEVLAVFPSELVSTDNIKALFGCPAGPPSFCGLPPMIPAEAVPTSVAVGPDGYYYVGELKGFPAPTGASNIWKVAPGASWAECGASPDCMKVFDGGFTSILDLAFGPDGRLYVAELDEASWAAIEIFGLITGGTVNACDLDTGVCEEVVAGVPVHTAITFGKDGTLWATQNALFPTAEVIRVP